MGRSTQWLAGMALLGLGSACDTSSGSPAFPPDEAGGAANAGFGGADDCAPGSDGSLLILDRDGDGRSAWWHSRCGVVALASDTRYRNADCDDTDPALFRYAWRDADGDGATIGEPLCVGTLPVGYAEQRSWESDCDDADPSLEQLLYEDADRDGSGSKERPVCSPSTAFGPAPDGLSLSASDCNDADPAICPGAPEQWHDGVDTDCDGQDDPLTCEDVRRDCGCELLAVTQVTIDPTCAGPDAFVARQVKCEACAGRTIIAIGNRGSLGATRITISVDGAPFLTLGELAPGAVSLPLRLPSTAEQVVLTTLPSDCDPSNDSTPVESSAGICDP